MGVTEKMTAIKPDALLGIRHLQTLMLFVSLLLVYSMRVSMSIAIVAMTDKDEENTFDWNMQTQSVILSSFFWGYVVLQIPGGVMAAKFGGSVLLTTAVGINSIISLCLPIAAYNGGWQGVCACRVLQGLLQGMMYPSINNLIGKWVPIEEKSRLGTIIFAGAQLGTTLQLVAAGFIAQYWGWPAIFYINGALGAIWIAFYLFVGSASPQESKIISTEERLYIQTSLGHVGVAKKLKTPWKSILTSVPFLALIIVHSCEGWGFWTLMTEIPSYFKQVLGVDIKSNGLISALPYLAMYLLSFPFGFLSDYAVKTDRLSVTATRKITNAIALFGPAIALIGLSYSPAGNTPVAAILLTIAVGLNAGYLTGILLIPNDIAPNFAGTLMGISNCIANIFGIIAPLAAGAILKDETDPSQWRKVFYISSALFIVGNTFHLIFGTSAKQKWNDEVDSITESIESPQEFKTEKDM